MTAVDVDYVVQALADKVAEYERTIRVMEDDVRTVESERDDIKKKFAHFLWDFSSFSLPFLITFFLFPSSFSPLMQHRLDAARKSQGVLARHPGLSSGDDGGASKSQVSVPFVLFLVFLSCSCFSLFIYADV